MEEPGVSGRRDVTPVLRGWTEKIWPAHCRAFYGDVNVVGLDEVSYLFVNR
jgi:hypothetical protein